LEKMQVPSQVMEGFSAEFRCGMAGGESRSRRLGGTGGNSPPWGGGGGGGQGPHPVVMGCGENGLPGRRKASIKGDLWSGAFDEIRCLPTSNLDGVEPFGFIDGISQPALDWEQTRKVPINRDQLTYGNIVSLGEFLMGYSNEYGRFTDRP